MNNWLALEENMVQVYMEIGLGFRKRKGIICLGH